MCYKTDQDIRIGLISIPTKDIFIRHFLLLLCNFIKMQNSTVEITIGSLWVLVVCASLRPCVFKECKCCYGDSHFFVWQMTERVPQISNTRECANCRLTLCKHSWVWELPAAFVSLSAGLRIPGNLRLTAVNTVSVTLGSGVCGVRCTVYSMYIVQCTVYSVQCTVYSMQYAVCSVQYKVYSAQCEMCSVLWCWQCKLK